MSELKTLIEFTPVARNKIDKLLERGFVIVQVSDQITVNHDTRGAATIDKLGRVTWENNQEDKTV